MKAMGRIQDQGLWPLYEPSRQTSQQAPHRCVTMNNRNGIGSDYLDNLLQRFLIVLKHKRRSGNGDGVNVQTQLPESLFFRQISRFIHVCGIMYHIAHLFQDIDIFSLKL